MHGNVSEWIWNRSVDEHAWTFGGSWQDAAYNFFAGVPVPLLERSPTVGFRLMHDSAGVPAALLGSLDLTRAADTINRLPASDDVYAAYAQNFAYRPGELNAADPVTAETTDNWIRQRVTVDTGYGERMDIVLFVPKRSPPPYQALVYFPPVDAMLFKLSSDALQPGNPSAPLDFIVKSGRVFVHPIYQGTYERFSAPLQWADERAMQQRWVDWRWDLGRTLDYLETRADIDAERIGYIGVSFGASVPMHLPALESRFRAAVLLSGGLPPGQLPPSLDAVHYAARITMPVLMMNGRFDYIEPAELQSGLFDLLGTPAANKRRVVVDAGHIVPRADTLRESLGWLDEYLGPVR
jgi:predicted esterase